MLSLMDDARKRLPLSVRMQYGRLRRKAIPYLLWTHEEFQRYYRWLQETQWWSREELEQLQVEQLQSLIRHAYDNVPYYRRIFEERHLKPQDIAAVHDLCKLPVLTKEDVRKNAEDLIARNIDRSRLFYAATSGFSGEPLAFYRDKYTAGPRETAFRLRQWNWAGYRFGDSFVTLRGNLVTRLEKTGKRSCWDYNTHENELVLSSLDMSDDNMHLYIDLLRKFKPKFLNAYPSSLEILVRFMRRNGIRDIKVSAIFCESETLYPWQRELIESQFSCKIFAGYGLSERTVDATECEAHAGYHIGMEYGVLELLDASREPVTAPGVVGTVVGTGFDTYCMPLIRYATDDLATRAVGCCNCGRQSPRIKDFKGRMREFIVSKDGDLIPFGPVYAAYHGPILAKIRELQYYQEQEGRLVVRIAKVSSYSEDEIRKEFAEELRKRLDEQRFDIEIVFVDQVIRGGRGKLGYLLQRLPIILNDLDHIDDSALSQLTEDHQVENAR